MFIRRSCVLVLPLLALLAAESPNADDLERNRQLLNKWKADPEHSARLQRDLRDFWELPKSQRRQLRQLDRDYHLLDAKMQNRLWTVAQRYLAWLERLPQAERQQIEQTKDTPQRLQLVRSIREQQWIERLPRKVREEVEKLSGEERAARIAQLRKQERQQRLLWSRPVGAKQRPK